MSVWPDPLPEGGTAVAAPVVSAGSWLSGAEGELLAIRISVDPRLLEKLLDALARLDFPINPQIYHSAALMYVYPDGRQDLQPITTVEFPAYAGRLAEVKAALETWTFSPASLAVRNMLDDIHCEADPVSVPAGAAYEKVVWIRHAPGRLEQADGAGHPQAMRNSANAGPH